MIYGASAPLYGGQKQGRHCLCAATVRDYLEEIG